MSGIYYSKFKLVDRLFFLVMIEFVNCYGFWKVFIEGFSYVNMEVRYYFCLKMLNFLSW